MSNYKNLKENGRWGNKGVGVIIYDPFEKKFGLALRSEFVLEPLTYGTIGGSIEKNKEKDALKKEIKEEIGIDKIYSIQKLYTHKDKEKKFKYTTYIAILKKPAREIEFNLNWENISLNFKSLDYWRNNSNLHFGVKEIFKNDEAISKLKDWENFNLENAKKEYKENNKKISRMNKEMSKIKEKDSDIYLFINSVKSRAFKKNNKLKSKLKRF